MIKARKKYKIHRRAKYKDNDPIGVAIEQLIEKQRELIKHQAAEEQNN